MKERHAKHPETTNKEQELVAIQEIQIKELLSANGTRKQQL